MMNVRVASFAALLVCCACGGESESSPGLDGGSTDADADATTEDVASEPTPPVDPSCKDGDQLFAVPSGTCVLGATCSPSTRVKCPDGFVPLQSPKSWSCACPVGVWKCEIVNGGGMNIPSCDGHLGDGAAD